MRYVATIATTTPRVIKNKQTNKPYCIHRHAKVFRPGKSLVPAEICTQRKSQQNVGLRDWKKDKWHKTKTQQSTETKQTATESILHHWVTGTCFSCPDAAAWNWPIPSRGSSNSTASNWGLDACRSVHTISGLQRWGRNAGEKVVRQKISVDWQVPLSGRGPADGDNLSLGIHLLLRWCYRQKTNLRHPHLRTLHILYVAGASLKRIHLYLTGLLVWTQRFKLYSWRERVHLWLAEQWVDWDVYPIRKMLDWFVGYLNFKKQQQTKITWTINRCLKGLVSGS